MDNHEVATKDLRKVIDPAALKVRNLKDIQPLETIIGQKRAMKALDFGVGNKAYGFNIYVSGYPGTGRLTAVKNFIKKKSIDQAPPFDWCYVNNFKDAYYPRVLRLPKGMARMFRDDMRNFILDVQKAFIKAFEGAEYLKQKEKIINSVEQEKNDLVLSLNDKAAKEGLSIQQSPFGITSVVLNKKKEKMSSEEFNKLSKSDQQNILKKQDELKEEIKDTFRNTRNIEKMTNEKLKKLDREVGQNAISPLVEEMEEKYKKEEDVRDYLEEVRSDIIEHFSDFMEKDEQQQQTIPVFQAQQPSLMRYEVNVFIDNSETEGAPLVQELNPTYTNLFGTVEKESQMGMLTTDFTLIKSGSS